MAVGRALLEPAETPAPREFESGLFRELIRRRDAGRDASTAQAAAEALASTPFFAGLSSVELARLVPELEERSYEAGEVIFSQGDPPDGLYLIRRGEARVLIHEHDQGETLLATLRPPEYFGEMALVSADARSATVEAVTALEVWRLSAERFRDLVARHTSLPLEIAAGLSRRLAATDRDLLRIRDYAVSLALEALPAAERELLLRASASREIDPAVLGKALGRPGPCELLDGVERRGLLLERDERGRYRFAEESLRTYLYSELTEALGERGLRRWHEQLATVLEAEQDWSAAADHYLAAEAWGAAARLLRAAGADLLADDPGGLERRLRSIPADRLAGDPRLLALLARSCLAQGKTRDAIEAYERALESAGRLGSPPLELEQALAELHDGLGPSSRATGAPGTAVHKANATATDRAGRQLSGVLAAAAAVLLLAAWFSPPPPGMSPAALRAVLLLLGALGVSLLRLLPDFLTFLLMLALWVAAGIVPARVAASGFASPTWFLMLSTMALGVGLARSGLLYRVALEIPRRLPASYPVLTTGLAVLGVLVSPGMPYVAGRVALAMPVARDIADALRFPARGGGAAGLALATLLGFGLMGSLFLTGTPMALVVYGLLPPAARAEVTFASWFLAALPLHLVMFVGMLAFILWRYRPGEERVSERTLRVQRAVLGRVSGGEWLALAVLLLLLVGFTTQPIHGVEPAWLGLFGVAAMIAGRLVDTDALRREVNWPLLLYFGVALSLGEVFRAVELDAWLAGALVPLLDAAGLQPGLLLIGIALLALIASLALGMLPAILLLVFALLPISAQLGMSPWVVGLTVIVAANQWLYPQENIVYLSLYAASEERAFSHAQARPAAIAFAALTILGLAVSVPYWHSLGLLR